MASGIYGIRNKRTGLTYVGSSVNIRSRWGQHRTQLDSGSHSNRQLQRDWKYYGPKAFDFVILEKVRHHNDLTNSEQRWIDHYIESQGLHTLYNIQLSVPQRTTKPIAKRPAASSGLNGCLLAPFEVLEDMLRLLPWHSTVPCAAVGTLAMLISIVPNELHVWATGDELPRIIGETDISSLFNGVTFLVAACWFYIWYWRLHPPAPSRSRETIVCPNCKTSMIDTARFCTACGAPHTSVQKNIEREAAATGQSYDELLEATRVADPGPVEPESFIQRWETLARTRSLHVSLIIFTYWVTLTNVFLFVAAGNG